LCFAAKPAAAAAAAAVAIAAAIAAAVVAAIFIAAQTSSEHFGSDSFCLPCKHAVIEAAMCAAVVMPLVW
jgi:exosortase/archaeosortase